MSVSTVSKKVVSFEDGRIGMQIFNNDVLYATLVSDIVPKTQAEIDMFVHMTTGETVVTKMPEGNQPLEDEEKKANVARAVHVAKDILGKITLLPERAGDYGISVQEKTESILSWVEEKDHVTDKQLNSLENMSGGIDKWLSSY